MTFPRRSRLASLALTLPLTMILAACGDDGDGKGSTVTPTSAPATQTAPPTGTAIPSETPVATQTAEPTKAPTVIEPGDNDQDTIQGALIGARPGDVILLRAGTYHLTGQLSLDVDNVTILGEGKDETILSFAGQTTGGEGLLVQADNFLIHDLALEDSPGDLLKILGGDGVTIRNVRAEWTGGPDPDNGSYALYPVQCHNVLIEDCVVRGASDAGVYVGQSSNIIVRRNTVEFNVAGVEIENSTDADVYQNVARQNTGGILVFNLPGLPVRDGRRTRVFENMIAENDTPNFAPGGIVQSVPSGTGMMILANDQVQVFNNTFTNNGTSNVIFISFNTAELLGGGNSDDPDFDPYCEALYIHDNVYEGGGSNPDPTLGPILESVVGGLPLPQIITDGDDNPDEQIDGVTPEPLRNCIQESEVTFVDLDVPNNFADPVFDTAAYDCAHAPLPPVVIPGVE